MSRATPLWPRPGARRRRWLGLMAVSVAIGLVAVYPRYPQAGPLVPQSAPSAQAQAESTRRVDEAARLLTPAATDFNQLRAFALSQPSVNGGDGGTQPPSTRREAPSMPSAPAPAPSSAMPALSGRPVSVGEIRRLVALTAEESAALGASSGVQPRIPDIIEQANERRTPLPDSLADLSISAALRFSAPSDPPFAVEAIRADPLPARARLIEGPARGGPRAFAGWVEVGDTPSPGWRVIHIAEDEVVVLSPHGNPMRLPFSLSADSAPAAGSGRAAPAR